MHYSPAKPGDKRLKNPTTALTKLLHDFGLTGSRLVTLGYFRSKSSVYSASRRDVNFMYGQTFVRLGEALKLTPGQVMDKLIYLQDHGYPPKTDYAMWEARKGAPRIKREDMPKDKREALDRREERARLNAVRDEEARERIRKERKAKREKSEK